MLQNTTASGYLHGSALLSSSTWRVDIPVHAEIPRSNQFGLMFLEKKHTKFARDKWDAQVSDLPFSTNVSRVHVPHHFVHAGWIMNMCSPPVIRAWTVIRTCSPILIHVAQLEVDTFPLHDSCGLTLNEQLHHPCSTSDDSLIHDSHSTLMRSQPVWNLVRPNREHFSTFTGWAFGWFFRSLCLFGARKGDTVLHYALAAFSLHM